MRLSYIVFRLAAFGIAACLCLLGAIWSANALERTSQRAVQNALLDGGQSWARVVTDGLQVILEGEAPTEARRFRAITVAGSVVDASRVIDSMSVKAAEGLQAPEFAIEILRNDAGVSLIGLLPVAADRDAIQERLQDIAGDGEVSDLLDLADYPEPDGWRPALEYGLSALERLPRSKISVAAGAVTIEAISDSPEQRRQIRRELELLRPPGVRVTAEISSPRPVITPFTTRFTKDAEGARFGACAADTAAAQEKILAAAIAAGARETSICNLGLGVPSQTWADAVAQSIAAVDALGGGTVTLSDTDVTLVALVGTEQALFDQVVGELDNSLPQLFALNAVLPDPPDETETGPPSFTATLTPDGVLTLRGKVADDLANVTTENYARAAFPAAELTMGTLVDDTVPDGWTIRVLAALEALSLTASGGVAVSPDTVAVSGLTGREGTDEDISRLLIAKLGDAASFSVNVAYREELDPIAALPTADECLQRVQAAAETKKITFDPGSASISADALSTLDALAEILRECPDLPIEIAGYTDSQGREEMNLGLSQSRAESVLSALRQRRVLTSTFRAVGYGEADPIADNETEEGREANRRIEFRLIDDEAEAEDAAAEGEADEASEADADVDAPDEASDETTEEAAADE